MRNITTDLLVAKTKKLRAALRKANKDKKMWHSLALSLGRELEEEKTKQFMSSPYRTPGGC